MFQAKIHGDRELFVQVQQLLNHSTILHFTLSHCTGSTIFIIIWFAIQENRYVSLNVKQQTPEAGGCAMETGDTGDSGKTQSCKMSNLLHGQKSRNQILPQEKGVNRDIFSTSNKQNRP